MYVDISGILRRVAAARKLAFTGSQNGVIWNIQKKLKADEPNYGFNEVMGDIRSGFGIFFEEKEYRQIEDALKYKLK